MSAVRARVDHDLCVGSTMCVQFADQHFELDDDRQSVYVAGETDDRDTVLEAAANCPMEAITVTDVDSGEVLFP